MNATYSDGWKSAQREMRDDRWTQETARKYLAMCEEHGCADGRDDFDRGYMDAVRARAIGGAQ